MSTGVSHFRSRLVASPCCLPRKPLTYLLPVYRELGFSKFEAFSNWAEGRLDWNTDPLRIRENFAAYGLTITSFHLPPIRPDAAAGLRDAIAAARFASRLGERVVVLFKASTKELISQTAKPFLDALEYEGIGVVPVLQNHAGSAISTLEDFRVVLAMIDDPRMKAVLEVGHFRRVGVDWRSGWDVLGDRIALIHVNEILQGKSVQYGAGEVDFEGLMQHIKKTGYAGDIVVELELESHETNPDETLRGLKQAMSLLEAKYEPA